MQSRFWLIGGATLCVTVGCTGPDRPEFGEDPQTSASSATGTSSPTSSASTASASDGGGGTNPIGPGGGDGGSGPGNGGAGGSGGASVCDTGGSVCIPETPAGWSEPLALFETPFPGDLTPCNFTDYPVLRGDGFGELEEGTAACDCSCEPAQGIQCTGPAEICFRGTAIDCSFLCTATDLNPGQCYSPGTTADYVRVDSPTPIDRGSCDAVLVEDVPNPTWSVKSRACGGASTSPQGCESGAVCAPRPGDGSHCVVKPGDVECPAEGYTNKRLRHDSFDDTRECSACSCGTADSTCGGSLVFTNMGCGPTIFVDEVAAGTCENFRGPDGTESPQNMEYNYAPSGTCPPSGGELEGEVTLDGTVTFCCLD